MIVLRNEWWRGRIISKSAAAALPLRGMSCRAGDPWPLDTRMCVSELKSSSKLGLCVLVSLADVSTRLDSGKNFAVFETGFQL
jgi:hypothetical protein